MNDITTNEAEFTFAPVDVQAGEILMTRDPKRGGKGVVKMLVPVAEISNYKAAGWTEA